ncbi:hypothetical protein [Paraburkholderia sp. WSM4175]|uniref:hypothetical protein n=1 Tax=Paraburkholderia sp. WSM4175 TaxID=2991072 RepID=UPI003D25FED9
MKEPICLLSPPKFRWLTKFAVSYGRATQSIDRIAVAMKLCVATNHGVWRLVAGFAAFASARAAEIVVVMEAVVALYSRIPWARVV